MTMWNLLQVYTLVQHPQNNFCYQSYQQAKKKNYEYIKKK